MGATLTERRRVRDEGLRVVNRCQRGGNAGGFSHRFDLSSEEGRAKFVPAAAVRRTVQTLFGFTGLKGCLGAREVGCEIPRLNRGTAPKTAGLEEDRGERNLGWSGEMR